MSEQEKTVTILKDAQEMFSSLCSNQTLTEDEEELRFLRAYRELNIANKINITSRIEEMLEAQMMKK
ncbi:MAG: hypothetical protein K2K06_04015 [Oscillospiraceae bacterium]|nr:hypothetical protein [Oscillospiraceae bacterium]